MCTELNTAHYLAPSTPVQETGGVVKSAEGSEHPRQPEILYNCRLGAR